MSQLGSQLGARRPPAGRYAVFLAICVIGAMVLEETLSIAGARPDFVIIGLTYAALAWGAFEGSILGFGLGLFRDILVITHLGANALGYTLLGYGLGKSRETLYLTTTGVDFALLAASKMLIDMLVLSVAAGGSWEAFETRFFWETPGSAIYTAVVGVLLSRVTLTR